MLDLEPGELGLGEGTEASLLENLPYEQIMPVSEQPWEDMTATPLDLGPDRVCFSHDAADWVGSRA